MANAEKNNKYLLIAIITFIFLSASAYGTSVEDQIRADATSIIAENLTTSDKAVDFLTYELVKLRWTTVGRSRWYDLSGDPISVRLSRLEQNSGTPLNEINARIDNLESMIRGANRQLTEQQATITQLESKFTSTSSNSVYKTLGNFFKEMGDYMVKVSGNDLENSVTSPSQPSTPPTPSTSTPPPPTPPSSSSDKLLRPDRISTLRVAESGHEIEKAIDGNPSTYYSKSYKAAYPESIDFIYNNAVSISRIRLASRMLSDNLLPETFSVLSSDDGLIYSSYGVFSIYGSYGLSGGNSIGHNLPTGDTTPHKYWRVSFPPKQRDDPNQLQFAELELYGST